MAFFVLVLFEGVKGECVISDATCNFE